MHAVRTWGAVLVLCAAALLQTSASSSSSQRPQSRTVRITVADLPPSATALPALNATSAPPSCRHGACSGAAQPSEAPREASFATRVPDVPSGDARNHVPSSGDASAKKRVHSDRVPHQSATTTHESHEDSFYKDAAYEHQDGDAATDADFAEISTDAVVAGQQQRGAYKYADHASAAERYDTSLTTPRIELFDRHHARVSQSIRQNLQELEEGSAATASAPLLLLQPTEVPTRKPSRAPAPQPFRRRAHLPTPAPGDDANVALEYTNHVSVVYNLTADLPRSANGELVLENGTHVDFTSSYVHSEIFPDDVTTQASVQHQRTKNATVASTPSNSLEDQSPGSSRIVDTVKSASIVHSAKDEDNIVVNNTSILSSNKTQPIRVTPGDNPSTTNRTTSRSQETIEVAPTTTPIPNEVLTTTAPTKSHRARFPPKRLKQGPSTTASPVTTETPPTDAVRPRTRARMIASPRAPANASNSVEDAPSPSMAAIAAAAAAARKTTRYSWRRPSPPTIITTSSSAPEKEDATDDDMVRVVVPTTSPNASETASRRLTQAARRATAAAAAAATRRGNVPADATPTPSAAVVRKFLSLRRRLPTTSTTTSTTAPTLTPAPEATTRRPSTALRRPSLATLQSRRRGSTRFGATDEDDDGGMAVPPTAAAWLLATLHGPAQSVPMPAAPAETTTTDSQPEEVIGVTSIGADSDGHLPAPAAPTPATSEGPNEVTDAAVATPTAPTPSPTPTPVTADTSAAGRPTPSVHSTPAVTTTDAVQDTTTDVVTSTSPVSNTSTIVPPSTAQSVGEDATTTEVNTTPGLSSSSAPFNAPAASSLDVEFVPLASTQTSTPEDDGTTTVAPVPIPIARSRNGTVQSSPSSLPPPTATAPATTTEGAGAATAASAPARSPASTTPLGPEAASETTVPMEAGGEGTTVDDVISTEKVTTDQPTTVGVTEPVGVEGAAAGDAGGGAETPTPLPEDTATTATTLPAPADAEPTSVGEQIATDSTVNTFLRITVQASWEALCRDREIFRTALAHMAAERFGRNVSVVVAGMGSGAGAAECERMHVDSTGETRLLPVTVYLLDERGRFDKQLVESFYMVVSQQQQPSPLQITRVDLMYGPLPTTSSDSNAGVIAAITISCVGAICLLLLAALLIIMRKRQKRFNYGQRCTPVSLDAYSLDSVSVYNSVRRKGALRASKRSYGNPAFDDPGAPSHPMNFAGLANFSSDRAALEEEFEIIPQISPKSDELPAGAETKNRFSNVIPLPETRVQLSPIEGESLSDYINANYVKGPKNETKFYIACQAPLPSTITDFWRMIWEHQTKAILMLTDLVENGVEKCADYLPPSEVLDCHRLFGDFQITLKKREERDKYIISTLQLKNLETNSWREVMHLWYLNWPHQGVPEEANSLIAFLIEARPYMRSNTGPTVVHCSPGTGRTGTVLACDICIRDFEQTRMVDIPRCVYQLRRDRAGAVKTKDQYVFIYQVLNTYATKLTGGGGSLDSI